MLWVTDVCFKMQVYQAAVAQLEGHIAAIDHVRTGGAAKDNGAAADYESSAAVVEREVGQMRSTLSDLEKKSKTSDAIVKLKSELVSLKKELASAEHRNTELSHDLRTFEKLATDSLRSMSDTHGDLGTVQYDLASIYEQGRNYQIITACGHRIAHRKRKETKLQPGP